MARLKPLPDDATPELDETFETFKNSIMARLSAEIVKMNALPEYREQLEKQAFEPLPGNPEQFPAFVRAELDKWGKVIKEAGIRVQ